MEFLGEGFAEGFDADGGGGEDYEAEDCVADFAGETGEEVFAGHCSGLLFLCFVQDCGELCVFCCLMSDRGFCLLSLLMWIC